MMMFLKTETLSYEKHIMTFQNRKKIFFLHKYIFFIHERMLLKQKEQKTHR